MAADLVRPDAERHGALVMTEAARPVLKGERAVTLRRDVLKAVHRAAPAAMVSEESEPLLAALKAERRRLAEAASVPAYVIFPDRTLIEMAERRPADLDAMAGISGVGAKKLERYGATFLSVITGAAPEPTHPGRRRLAGRDAGSLFDRLEAAQRDLERGPDGMDKPMSCPRPVLARIAETRPQDAGALAALLGERRAERFGDAFLALCREG